MSPPGGRSHMTELAGLPLQPSSAGAKWKSPLSPATGKAHQRWQPATPAMSWLAVRTHLALLRGSQQPESRLLIALFTAKVPAGQPRGWVRYHPIALAQAQQATGQQVQAPQAQHATDGWSS